MIIKINCVYYIFKIYLYIHIKNVFGILNTTFKLSERAKKKKVLEIKEFKKKKEQVLNKKRK